MRTRGISKALALGLAFGVGAASADPFPPNYGTGVPNEAAGPIHFAPAAWPIDAASPAQCGHSCGEWKPYGRFQNALADPRVQDPSNGGTSPQNYVNVSSSCIDKTFPSIYYNLKKGAAADGSQDVIMFRWRVEQIANNYATGPNVGNHGSTDPWSSALWTVLFDLDGDGYRDIAAHLNGSSGSPSTPVDMIAGIWGNIPTQSIDYVNDPSIKLIAHNPTAFTSGGMILNFQSSVTPTTNWGAAPRTRWDYGTTRATLVSTNACNEYFIDYQIPTRMLDASPTGPNPALNGPKITRSTPISMVFCTANSLNNPFQKDCAINKAWAADATKPAPFGDYLSFDKEDPYSQPIISKVTATAPGTCAGNYALQAKVQDTLALNNGVVVPSVKAVQFYYYYDADGDGVANDGGNWSPVAPTATLKSGTLNTWNASWNTTSLLKGKYLVGVQAVDDRTVVDDDMPVAPRDNRTFSYAEGNEQGQAYINGAWVTYTPDQGGTVQGNFPNHTPAQLPVSTEDWYGNPDVVGPQVAQVGLAINACGLAPTISKSATPSSVATGDNVNFSVTISNATNGPITLSSISDALPNGFTYQSTTSITNDGVTLAATASPTVGASGTISWSFAGPTIAASKAVVLSFVGKAGSTAGNYNNTATASTSFGTLTSDPVAVGVDAARISLSKTPNLYSINPDGSTQLIYTLRYSNDSAVPVTAASISDVLPANITYVGCSGGTTCSNAAGTVNWTLGTLAGGASGTVTLTVTVNTNYPSSSLLNSATLSVTAPDSSTVTKTANSTVAVNVPVPAFSLEKSAPVAQVAPSGSVTWTINYRNYGSGAAAAASLTDTLPDGFTFSSCSVAGSSHYTTCSNSGGVITFDDAVAGVGVAIPAGGNGSVSVTATAAASPFTFSNPATNSAKIVWSGNATGISATSQVGVTGQFCSAVYYFRQGVDNALATIRPASLNAPTSATEYSTDLNNIINTTFDTTNQIAFESNALGSALDISNQTLTINFITRTAQGGARIQVVLERIPTAGAPQLLATSGELNVSNGTNAETFTATVPAATTLLTGEKLRWRFQFRVSGGTRSVSMLYDSTVNNSRSSFCKASAPANLIIDKTVDKANVASVPATLQYTIKASNTGGSAATGASLSDTLPANVTLTSVTLNGAAVTPTPTVTAQVFSLPVNSSGQAAGTIAAGATATVVVNASATASASGTLTNSATVSATGLTSATDTADTLVGTPGAVGGTPALSIIKSVDKSLLSAGESATYTLTVVNTGTGAASSVVVTDDFPNTAYFSYAGCTAPAGTTCSETPAGTLSWNIGTLAAAQSRSLSFQMNAAATGIPAGVTNLNNSATVADSNYCTGGAPPASCTSAIVPVTISGAPKLSLSKQVSPTGTRAPGDLLTYTLTVTNSGSSSATKVQVSDPIPANTAFVAVTSAGNGSGSFDTVNNRVVFNARSASGVDELSAGDNEVLSFTARVVDTLPQGSTTVTNTASASAANAPTQTATVSSTVTAAPVMTLNKQGPTSLALPATTLAAAASASSTVFVTDSSRLSIGAPVRIGSSMRRITKIAGQAVTLDAAVTAASGAQVLQGITYSLTYGNTGNADASSVVITDTLPANLLYASASPTPTTAPAVGSAGAISFTVGAVPAGAIGVLQVSAVPSVSGSYTNSAVLTATGIPNVTANLTTVVGGLVVDKRTTTPTRAAGATATYVLRATNTLATAINGVALTDSLPPGFTYVATTRAQINGTTTAVATAPSAGSATPSWSSFSIPANGVLEIEFTALIDSNTGPATYDNEVSASNTSAAAVTPFDHLSTTADDVTVLASNTGVVSGVLYFDSNGNGVFDPLLDTPLPNVTLLITDSANITYQLASDSSGIFRRVVRAGTTTVDVGNGSLPSGLAPTIGIDGLDPNSVEVPDGGSAEDNNGFVTASGAVGNVAGRVWNDDDNNQAQNGTEAGRLGVLLELRDAATNGLMQRTFTDLRGDYFFANVSAGNYRVDISPPVGTTVTTANDPASISVVAGNTSTANFGLIAGTTSNADLSILKTNGQTQLASGVATIYSLTISNAGPAAVSNALIWDPAASGLNKTAISCGSTTGGATCPATPTVADLESGILAIPSLPSGSSLVLSVTATVTAVAGTSVNNLAVVSAPQGVSDPNQANNTSSDNDPVAGAVSADLAVTKSNGVSSLSSGSSTSYSIVVSNAGPSPANGATVSDPIAAGLSKTAVTCGAATGGAACPGTTTIAALESGSLAIPTLPSGGSVTLTVTATVTAAAGGSVTNTVTVSTPTGVTDPTPANNTASDTDTVAAPAALSADLSASKDDGVNSVLSGASTTYSIVISNAGPNAADGAAVSDPATTGLNKTAISCTGASGGAVCPVSPSIAAIEAGTLLLPTLPSGGAVTLSVTATVTAAAGANVSNTVSVTTPAGVTDPVSTNNTATDTDAVVAVPVPALSFSKAATLNDTVIANSSADAGETISYTLTATNSGGTALSGVSISDPRLPTLNCVQPVALATGASLVCSGTYTVSQADVDAATAIVNTASATASPPTGPNLTATDTRSTPVTAASSGLDLVKLATLNDTVTVNGTADAGETISYQLTARNTGGLSLSAVSISDPRLPSLSCTPAQPASLAPGASLVCTGSYTVTQGDINAAVAIVNTATATGTPPTGGPITDTDSTSTPVTGGAPAIDLVKLATLIDTVTVNTTADVAETISYRLTARNTGSMTLSAVSISDPRLPSLNCTPAQPASLAPGASLLCTGTYTVTQADVDAGVALVNTATTSGTPPSGPPVTDTDSISTPVTASPPIVGVSKVLLAQTGSGAGPYTVDYEMRVRNYGTVGLNNVQLNDDLAQTFPTPVQFTVLSVSVIDGPLLANAGFDGRADTRMMQPGGSLAPGAWSVLQLRLRITPNGMVGPFFNSAVASAVSAVSGAPVSDMSFDGNTPDPDNNGQPDELQPTPVEFLGAGVPRQIPSGGALSLGLLALLALWLGGSQLRRRTRIR